MRPGQIDEGEEDEKQDRLTSQRNGQARAEVEKDDEDVFWSLQSMLLLFLLWLFSSYCMLRYYSWSGLLPSSSELMHGGRDNEEKTHHKTQLHEY